MPGTCYNDHKACIGDGVKSERNLGRTMSRKSKPSKHKKKFTTSLSQVDKYLDLIGHQIFQGNYTGAVADSERLLNYLPNRPQQPVDVLNQHETPNPMF